MGTEKKSEEGDEVISIRHLQIFRELDATQHIQQKARE
jgi:hypothetical protein